MRESLIRAGIKLLTAAALVLLVTTGISIPSLAETGTVSVVFTKASFVVGVGGGKGVLTFHGNSYPFTVRGASIGATIGASTTKLVGKALNMNGYRDITGTYNALGAGGALAAGAGVVRLQNASGVILQLHGVKVGAELSANLSGVTISMD